MNVDVTRFNVVVLEETISNLNNKCVQGCADVVVVVAVVVVVRTHVTYSAISSPSPVNGYKVRTMSKEDLWRGGGYK